MAFIKMSLRLGIPLARVRDALATLPADRVPTSRDWARLAAGWACALFNPDDALGADGPRAVLL